MARRRSRRAPERFNRLHKALEDAGIKRDGVASEIMGTSGRHMLGALIAGERDPEVLASLARRQMRKKIPALREARQGRFEEHHALWLGAILAHIDSLDHQRSTSSPRQSASRSNPSR